MDGHSVMSGVEFIDGLRGTSTQAFHVMDKLRDKIKTAEEDGLNLLSSYVEQSPDCGELLDQLNRSDFLDNDKAHTYALDLLCRILDDHFTLSVQTQSTKSVVCVKILEALKSVYHLLNTDNNYYLKTCLRCLSQIAKLTPSLLLAEFNFEYKPFVRLCNRRSRGRDPVKSVRSLYLLLAKVLLQSPDSAVVLNTLRIPKYLQPMLKLLSDDHPPYVLDFIAAIHGVVDNRQIPRAPKKQLFNGPGIRSLTALLEHKDMAIAQKTYEILHQYLTSSFYFRMYPKDVSALFDFCTKTRPLHIYQQQLILATLQAHPHLHTPFMSTFRLVLFPRLSLSWLWGVRFVSALLRMERVPEDDRAALSSAVELCLPPNALSAGCLTQGLLHQHSVVRDATVTLLASVLMRARTLQTYLDDPARTIFRRQLLMALPDLHTLLALVRSVTQCSDENEAIDVPSVTDCDVIDPKEARHHAQRILPCLDADAYVQWVDCVRLYVEVLPLSLRDCKFDWTKILVTDKTLFQSTRALASLRLVETAFLCDGRFLGSNMSKPVQAYFQYLVDATIHGVEAKQALCRLLRTFAIFDDAEVELGIWIQQLLQVPECAPFFVHVILHLTQQAGFYVALSHDIHQDYAEDRPSLCYLAAVHQHSLGFPLGVDRARLFNAVASELAIVSPNTCAGMMRVIKHFDWKEKEKKRSLYAVIHNPESTYKRNKRGLCGFISLLQGADGTEDLAASMKGLDLDPAETACALLAIFDAVQHAQSKRKLALVRLVPDQWIASLAHAPSSALRALTVHPCWDGRFKPNARKYRCVHFSMLADILALMPCESAYARLLECLKDTPEEALVRKVVALSASRYGLQGLIELVPAVDEPLVLIRALVEEKVDLSELVGPLRNEKPLLALLTEKSPACWIYRLHHLFHPESFSLKEDSALFTIVARLSSSFRTQALSLKDRYLHRLALIAPFVHTSDIELLETNCDAIPEELLRDLLKQHPTLASKLHATEISASLCLAETQGVAEQHRMLKGLDNTLLTRWIPRFHQDAAKGLQLSISTELAMVLPPGCVPDDAYATIFEGDTLSSEALQIAARIWPSIGDTGWKPTALEKIRSSYRASLSEDDLARRSVLMSEARNHDNWEFHLSMCFDWSLDGLRLRETLDTFFSEPGHDTYDLCYLLPFFYARLHTDFSSGSLPLRLVCQGGVLQILLYGMATEWREWSYRGLAVVKAALQQGWEKNSENRMAFREVPQMTLLLESLRNAIPPPKTGYPTVGPLVCAFMATAVGILLHPEHNLYLEIGRFLLSRPYIDLEDVPMFSRRFYSERSEDRTWIIKVLRRGGPNWSLFARRHVVQSILAFAGSTLCDFGAWADCLRFLGTLRPGVREELGVGRVENFGAAEWIIGETRKSFGNEKLETIALEKLVQFLSAMARGCLQYDATALLGAALALAESATRLKSVSLGQKLWPVVLSIAKLAEPTEFGHRLLLCFRQIVPMNEWDSVFSFEADDMLALCRLCPADTVVELLVTHQVPKSVIPVEDVVSALQALLQAQRPIKRDAVLFFLTIPVSAEDWKVNFLCALLLLHGREIPDAFLDLPDPFDLGNADQSSQARILLDYAHQVL